MAEKYTDEQLNHLSTDELITIIRTLRDELDMMNRNYMELNHTMQLMMEQLADAKRHRFGRSTEKLEEPAGQIAFMETDDGIVYFNEAEAVDDLGEDPSDDEEKPRPRGKKRKGKRGEDIKDLPVRTVSHEMTDDELRDVFGDEKYKRLPDEIQREYYFKPAEIGITEHHIAVYSGRDTETMVKADHPKKLIKNSLASPSLMAGIITAKYVNAAPLYRQEVSMNNDGIAITRKDMARWIIKVSNKYLHPLYELFKEHLLSRHVIQADETPVIVNKDGRPAGSKSYMWVYRTGVYDDGSPVVLYEYQKTRKADHPLDFLKDFSGVCTTDGYQVYHTAEDNLENLVIAGCYAHARRKYDEAIKVLPKEKRKGAYAYTALKLIQAIYSADSALKDLPARERQKERQKTVAPLVDAYFEWIKSTKDKVLKRSKTDTAMQYSLNQETYLRVFLSDGDVPMDNNGAERAIRPFCVGKKNWQFCDTLSGASASAVVYSVTETAKANGLRPYYYLDHILRVMAAHADDSDNTYLYDLLPWSDKLPKECYKVVKEQNN
ncbi:MAG: IS66 family transposase [Desulfovibrio sp.]|nr:IS66 family transposase [Desulfovibrio sp.]